MNSKKVNKPAGKKLLRLEEIFQTEGASPVIIPAMQSGVRQEIAISLLDAYQEHAFTTYTGKRFEDMVDSIRSFGVIQPVIVRKKERGRYEILAGHNRTNAAKQAGLSLVPAVVVEADDELAALIVTETNLVQRSFADMPVSEKAKILKTHCKNLQNAQKRKAWLADLEQSKEVGRRGTNLSQIQSRELVGQEYGLTGRDVSRLIRIGNLIPDLQQKVDERKIPIAAAVDLSYLSVLNQKELADIMKKPDLKVKISMKKAAELRDLESQGLLFSVSSVLLEGNDTEKTKKPEKQKEKFKEGKPADANRLILRNDEERKQWLTAYEDWGIWLSIPQLGLHVYRCDLPDGSSIVVDDYYQGTGYRTKRYHLVDKKHPYGYEQFSITELIAVLRQAVPNR